MRKKWWDPLIILFIVGTLVTCIDPYSPKLDKFQSVLVVDALLTDENVSDYVILSRTTKMADEKPVMIPGALVIIKDDLGNSTMLSETSEGIYKTDSLVFKGEIGRSYTLYIKTEEGEEYESEPCLMYPVQDIDTIYFKKDREIINNETQEGIRIYVDSKDEDEGNYYRWTFDEYWKFEVPYPKLYDYVDEHTFIECSPVKKTCWHHNKSSEIVIKPAEAGSSNPILFIASDKSDRLLIQYCIQVRQLSISKKEYEFWDRMQQIAESGGNIFDKQPFQISGNIHNKNNSEEKVLGYFQVSGAKWERRYIVRRELSGLDLPHYYYDCSTIVVGKNDFPTGPNVPPPTFDKIYAYYNNANCIFIKPLFISDVMLGHILDKLVFVTPVCSDCSLSGSLTKPDFWTDLD